jgi:hypothetical protein
MIVDGRVFIAVCGIRARLANFARRFCAPVHFGLGAHFRLLSALAQARATSLSADVLPGMVAQPPFSTKELCSQLLIFFSATKVSVASVACWNLSTQMGASAAMTAVLALLSAICFAVVPSVHPPQVKPMINVARQPATAPCKRRFSASPGRFG